MVEPIRSTAPQTWPALPKEPLTSAVSPSKDDLRPAEEEVASLYYQSSIKSLAVQMPAEKALAMQADEKKATEKSIFGKAKDWLWGIFGWGKAQPVAEEPIDPVQNVGNDTREDPFAGGTPRLQAPDNSDKKRLSQSIADLNQHVNRMKDTIEFEEEMRKTSSGQLDKLIFLQLINFSINQKKLKEATGLILREDLIYFHNKNKTLQEKHYNLVDAIVSENKARGVLKWINVGLTAVAVGGSALGFAIGGPAGFFAVGIPLSLIGKGTTTLIDGILKHKNDNRTGDLVIVKQETKANHSTTTERMSEMQATDAEVAALLKMIRQHLDNQTKAERASFGRNA